MITSQWCIVTADHQLEPVCGTPRGPRSHTRCELPPDHITGRNHTPMHEEYHTGRSPTGRWFSWPPVATLNGGAA